jgi:hypothetical protein
MRARSDRTSASWSLPDATRPRQPEQRHIHERGGAVSWFNGNSTVSDRQVFNRTLTDGTVGTLDFQDAHTVAVSLSGYFFEKTVANLTRGVSPATTAIPGDTLRYTLRSQKHECGVQIMSGCTTNWMP